MQSAQRREKLGGIDRLRHAALELMEEVNDHSGEDVLYPFSVTAVLHNAEEMS